MLTPLFLAIGLPAEGIGILIAVDAIPDTFATVLNTTGDLTAAALVASFRETETTVLAGPVPTHDRQNQSQFGLTNR
jgi:Na+/H+-dicarboxylate symporter